jgi:hypothetical protein
VVSSFRNGKIWYDRWNSTGRFRNCDLTNYPELMSATILAPELWALRRNDENQRFRWVLVRYPKLCRRSPERPRARLREGLDIILVGDSLETSVLGYDHSSAAGDGNSQQERDQQRAKRRFPRDVAQDAQWHAGLSTRFYRAADPIDCPFYGVGDFLDSGFRFWSGIQTFVGKWGQRVVITHDQISKPTNSQSIKA